jgi:hypothetical protein
MSGGASERGAVEEMIAVSRVDREEGGLTADAAHCAGAHADERGAGSAPLSIV